MDLRIFLARHDFAGEIDMADARGDNRSTRSRPMSPHLSIWRWSPPMLVSILHRVTGNAMATVGLMVVLIWFLGSLASGPGAYENFADAMGSIPGMIVLIGLSWSFFNHMSSGIRHLVMDVGAGFEITGNKRHALVSLASGIILTIAFWAVILLK
jgi:succinate dehydrogenase / fumarate reductase cytochrome b subunit